MDGVNALALLRHAHAPADNRGIGSGVHARSLADSVRIDTADLSRVLRRVTFDDFEPFSEAFGMSIDERLVVEALGHDNVRHGVKEGNVRAVLNLEVNIGDARRLDDAGVDNDDFRSALSSLHDAPSDDWVACRRVITDKHDAVGLLHTRNGDAHCATAERVDKADDRRAVAGAGAVVDVVGTDTSARELLHHKVCLVSRAARGTSEQNRVGTVLRLDFHKTACSEIEGLVPRHALELAALFATNHRMQNSRRQNLRIVDEIKSAQTFEAKIAFVGNAVKRLSVDNHAVLDNQVQLATRTTVRAHCHMFFHEKPLTSNYWLYECS